MYLREVKTNSVILGLHYIFDTIGTKNILHISILRLLPKAAFPGIPVPDVRLQISPAL